MEAHLNQCGVLKKIIEAVKEFIDDSCLDCSSTGIQLQAMDANHVTLVQFLLRSEGFESYRCDRTISLGIKIQSLLKILKCASNEDSATFKAVDNGDILNIAFSCPDDGKSSEFDLKLMGLNQEHLNVPDTPYDATITFSSAEFQRICRDLRTLSETVSMAVVKNSVKFAAEGEVGKGTIYLKSNAAADSDEKTTIEVSEPVTCSLSLKHMLLFTKATPLNSVVKISLSNSFPMKVEYSLGDMGYLRYFLAPKIDEE